METRRMNKLKNEIVPQSTLWKFHHGLGISFSWGLQLRGIVLFGYQEHTIHMAILAVTHFQ